MKINRLNTIIFIGFLAIVGVIIMQLFLLSKAHNFEKKDIDNKIHFALQDVVKKIYRDNASNLVISNRIERVSNNYYIVNVDDVFENNILEHYLKIEFEKVKLDLDFEYAIYNCSTDEMVYGNYISSDGQSEKKCQDCFIKDSDLIYYFGIRFPEINKKYFADLQEYWIFTIVLFFVLGIYVYSVVLLMKQKKYTELQTDFINNMTHEFKTPLSSILIASNYVASQIGENNDKLKKYTKIIINQSNKLNHHIEQILSVAKAGSRQIELEKTKINFYDILLLLKENSELKYKKNFSFTIDASCKYFILADEFHFYNLIYNLVDNALKYGKENIALHFKTEKTDNFYTILFTDNGSGIPEKDLPFIFDKFYRVNREDTKTISGFGIGLAYVKKIIMLHKWTITVKNKATDNGLVTAIKLPKKDVYDN